MHPAGKVAYEREQQSHFPKDAPVWRATAVHNVKGAVRKGPARRQRKDPEAGRTSSSSCPQQFFKTRRNVAPEDVEGATVPEPAAFLVRVARSL